MNNEKVVDLIGHPSTNKPVLVSKDFKIVDGHHRWAARKMEGKDINAIVIDSDFETVRNHLLKYDKSFTKHLHESMNFKLSSHFGNEISAYINNTKYTFIVDGDSEEIYKKTMKLCKYTPGKALNFLKKMAIDSYK